MSTLRAFRAEFAKAASLRMPACTAVLTVLGVVALSGLLTALVQRAVSSGRPDDVAGLDPSTAFFVLLHYGQIGVILFGCWLVFEEQEPGSLRTAVLATPVRVRLFFAKVSVAALGSLLIAVLGVFGSYAVRSILTGALPLTAAGAGDARVLCGYVAYWVLLGTFACALSAALRSGLVGLGALLVLVLALSPYLLTLTPLARFLPDQAGAQIYLDLPPASGDLGPGLGLTVLVLWVLVALGAGALSFHTWSVRN